VFIYGMRHVRYTGWVKKKWWLWYV
jgi:hypothetical protein